jgi:hypothetical protein
MANIGDRGPDIGKVENFVVWRRMAFWIDGEDSPGDIAVSMMEDGTRRFAESNCLAGFCTLLPEVDDT